MLLLITMALAPGMKRLVFDNSIDSLMPKNDHEYIYYNEVKKIYGDNSRFVIMAVSDHDLWSQETFRKFDDLISDIEEYEDFDEKREELRLKRFDKLASKGETRCGDLIQSFNDDPNFQRLLKRKIEKISAKIETLDGGDLKKLRKHIIYANDLKKQEVIDTIISPLTAQDITGKNDTLETYDLIETDNNGKRILPSSTEEIDKFREKLERNPAFEKGLYARNPQSGLITDFCTVIKFVNLKDQDPAAREVMEIIDSHHGLDLISSGVPFVNISINNYMHADLFKNISLVLLVVIIIFYLNFRSVRGVILPFITLCMAELWTFGLMGYIGYKVTAVGVSLPSLLIAVGSSYSIHILNQYYSDFDMITKTDRRAGLQKSMSHISLTVLLAGLTTFIAFMTLASSQILAIREWGIISAIGVMFAVFISCSLIPACLTLLPNTRPSVLFGKGKNVKTTIVDRIIDLMTKGAIVHHRKVLVVVIVLIVVSIAGLFRINIETDVMSHFKKNDDVRINMRDINNKFGGSTCYEIIIDSGEVDGVKSPEFLTGMEKLRAWLVSDDNPDLNIGQTGSFSDFIKTMHMAMNNDDPLFYKVPDNQMDIIDYLEIYSGDDDDSDGRFDEFEPYVDADFRASNLSARLCSKEGKKVSTSEMKYIATKISDYLEKNLPENYSFSISGFPMMNVNLVHYIVRGQLQSLFLSLIVVGIILTLLFQNIRACPLALIPMSVAVIANFGIMGWLQINLDVATSIIAAITIGIGVDDTVHFLNTFRQHRAEGSDIDEAITKTLAVSGKAILFTSLALIFGFSILITSHFWPIVLFGILMASTMINTTIGALLVLPAVIKATGVNLDKPRSETWLSKYLNIDKIFGLEQKD